jgi:exosortase A
VSGYSAIADAKSQEAKRDWAWHIGSLAAIVGLILAIFKFEVVNAVQVWWFYPTYSHCFLIIPISAWLVWEKRDTLAGIAPAVAPKALFAILPLLLMWLGGKFSTINEVRQFAVIGLIEVSILTMVGPRVFAAILFPALYLFFLVPAGQYLIPPMQLFATEFTDAGLNLLNIPHYTEGTLIQLPNGLFEVAEACAGLRFLIATIALGALFAHLTYTKWYKIIAFLAACIVVPLIANGFRCLGIIVLGYMTNNQAAISADHILYGWFFNVAILLVLGFMGSLFRDASEKPIEVSRADARPASPMTLLTLAAGTAFAISMGPALAYWHDGRPIVANAQALTAPLNVATWTVARPMGTWQPIYGGNDLEFITSFVPGSSNSRAVDVAIEYYGRIREGRSLVAATNSLWDDAIWHQTESRNVSARIGSEPLQLREAVVSSAFGKRLVWSTYWMDGRFTTSGVMIKLLQLKTILTGNESAALIALSTPIDGAQEDAHARLKTVLMSLSDLSTHLVAAGRQGAASKTSN